MKEAELPIEPILAQQGCLCQWQTYKNKQYCFKAVVGIYFSLKGQTLKSILGFVGHLI